MYGATVSKDTISRITDKVIDEITEWRNRPLDRIYPVLFIDAIVVKVRDGQVVNRPIYVVIGVTVNGERDILGLWAGDGNEGAKFWLAVLTEIKNLSGTGRHQPAGRPWTILHSPQRRGGHGRHIDPQEHERVLDPCCGTGGFLRETLRHLLDKWRAAEGTAGQPDTIEQLDRHQERLRDYADRCPLGADFDPFLVRAASMSVMMLTGAPGNTFYMDSLALPEGSVPRFAT